MSGKALPSKHWDRYFSLLCFALPPPIAFCGVLVLSAAAADVADPSSTRAPIEYRRIFVPAEKIDAWPRDGEKYFPIEKADFERLIDAVNQNASAQFAQVTIKNAEYTASFSEGQLTGEGQWTIELRGDKPGFLPLGQMSLRLRDVRWQDQLQSARLGTWGRNAQQPDRYGLEVPRSGVLKFSWKVSSRGASDQSEFPWHVARANSTRLSLDLPSGNSRLPGSEKIAKA